MVSPTSKKARATQQVMLVAARNVIGRTGVFSPEAIAETAGVSAATFYAHFGSKDQMLALALDQAMSEHNQRMWEALDIEVLLEEGLARVLTRLLTVVVEDSNEDGRLLRLAASRIVEANQVADVFWVRKDETLEMLTRFIRMGAAAGRIRRGPPEILARTVLVTIEGMQSPALAGPSQSAVLAESVRMLDATLGVAI
jgi:AcrR family transcriptional regulator